jgi:hypothetical protein
MIKKAVTESQERRSKIEGAVASMGFDNDPTATAFSVSVGSRMTQVGGKFSILIQNILHAQIIFR